MFAAPCRPCQTPEIPAFAGMTNRNNSRHSGESRNLMPTERNCSNCA
jgi:hypothetical protein